MSFKRAKVVMLPTKEKAQLGFLTQKGKERNDLRFFHTLMPNILDSENQHLYIISDDKIEEGDWYITADKQISQLISGLALPESKKIIATTDSSLGLPQPSQSFIEKYVEEYNKGNVITDVLVGYESKIEWHPSKIIGTTPSGAVTRISGNKWLGDFPKVNPKDNTITIKKVKDSWNREEIITLVTDGFWNGDFQNSVSLNRWIEKNL